MPLWFAFIVAFGFAIFFCIAGVKIDYVRERRRLSNTVLVAMYICSGITAVVFVFMIMHR